MSVTVRVGTEELTAESSDDGAGTARWTVSVPQNASYLSGTGVEVRVSASKAGFTAPTEVVRTLSLSLVGPVAPTYTEPSSLRVGEAITAMSPGGGAGIAAYVATGLPSGLVIDGASGVISGTPDRVDASPADATVTVTDAAGNPATVSLSFPAVVAANVLPTGLPEITGTTRVGQTLTASASGITDSDGLSGASFAWQWIANDGNADTTITGATSVTYTLTSAEVGKRIKVRVTFSDDGGTRETLVSDLTAAVAAEIPVVSIAPTTSPVTEGTAASFTLRRTGDTANPLTVSVVVREEFGSMLLAAPPAAVTFSAGAAEATLSAATENDNIPEVDSRVSATITFGSDYRVDASADRAEVDVYDNDVDPLTSATTLWTSTLTVQDIYGTLLGALDGSSLNPDNWSEGRDHFYVNNLYYFPDIQELSLSLTRGLTDPEQLTLHLDDLQLRFRGISGERFFYWTIDHPGWQANQAVAVRLTREEPNPALNNRPGLKVTDTLEVEAEGAVLHFEVALDRAQDSMTSVRYRTRDGSAIAGSDYVAQTGVLHFLPGQTLNIVSVPVLNDAIDEGRETMYLDLLEPFGAEIADGTGEGTIVNTDPIPREWIARFGRTVAEQVIDAVESRIREPWQSGAEVSFAGQSIGFGVHPDAPNRDGGGNANVQETAAANLATWLSGETGLDAGQAEAVRTMSQRELLLGSSFSVTGGTANEGFVSYWGRGSATRFDGREGSLYLDGEVTSAMIGADVSRGPWKSGLVVAHSLGEGGYRDGGVSMNSGTLNASLTGIYPWLRHALNDRLEAWGVAGYGEGRLKLERPAEPAIRTDMDLWMAAAGMRGTILDADSGSGTSGEGLTLTGKSDALIVGTSTDAVSDPIMGNLAAAEAKVTRLRLALEGSIPTGLTGGSMLTPGFEIGVRHDGGDAETGFGTDIGASLVWTDPNRGLSLELRGRGLLTHDAKGFRDQGVSGSFGWDPDPSSDRGWSFGLSQMMGASATGGVDALLSPDASQVFGMSNTAGSVDESGLESRRLEMGLGYGYQVLGGRYTLIPELAVGLTDTGREFRQGWSLIRTGQGSGSFEVNLEFHRSETEGGETRPENGIGINFNVRF